MIYQLRIFTDHPGRVPVHIDRFREHTCRMLEKHGVRIVGCWVSVGEDKPNQVVFMTAHESMVKMMAAKESFTADPEVKAMVAKSEKEGPIILDRDDWYLEAADFSPVK